MEFLFSEYFFYTHLGSKTNWPYEKSKRISDSASTLLPLLEELGPLEE
jgi:hypothetical protein